jgi:hypothetical protein
LQADLPHKSPDAEDLEANKSGAESATQDEFMKEFFEDVTAIKNGFVIFMHVSCS